MDNTLGIGLGIGLRIGFDVGSGMIWGLIRISIKLMGPSCA